MDNQTKYRELAVIEVSYWRRVDHQNRLFGSGIAYGYVYKNSLVTGKLYNAEQDDQNHYLLSAKRVKSYRFVSNLHDLKKVLKMHGHSFDQDDFIRFLKREKVAFHTQPITKLEKLHSQQLSDELRVCHRKNQTKQHEINKQRKLCKYLRKLGRRDDYRQFIELLFKYYKTLDRNHTTVNDIRRIVYDNGLFRMPKNVQQSLPVYGILI